MTHSYKGCQESIPEPYIPLSVHMKQSHFLGSLMITVNNHEGLKVSLKSYSPPTLASVKIASPEKTTVSATVSSNFFTYIIASVSGVSGHLFRFTDGRAFLLQLLSDHLSDLLKRTMLTMLNSFILQNEHTFDRNSIHVIRSAYSWWSGCVRF